MKAIDVEIAMMRALGIRQNLIVPNISWGIAGLHECDLLSLSSSGYATEIEIKISKSDLLKDSLKSHGHKHDHIKYLYFAVPSILRGVALEVIPERAGLYVIMKRDGSRYKYTTDFIRPAEPNSNCVKWSQEERFDLARLGAMRILGLKQKINHE